MLTERVYYGRARNPSTRWHAHKCILRAGKHFNTHLQRSWNKYGPEAFQFDIVSTGLMSETTLNAIEGFFIRVGLKCKTVYNILTCGTRAGIPHTEKTKRRISQAQIGRVVPPARRVLISQSLMGHVPSAQCLEKRRYAMTGQKRTTEQKNKIRVAHIALHNTPKFTAFDKSLTLNEWADRLGMNHGTLRNRVLRGGMSLEQALLLPVKRSFA